MKVQYYKSLPSENKNDVKKTWSILKQAVGKENDKTSLPLSFSIYCQTVPNKLDTADVLFLKIGETSS